MARRVTGTGAYNNSIGAGITSLNQQRLPFMMVSSISQVFASFRYVSLACGLLLCSSLLQAAEFTISHAESRLGEGVYSLDADIHYSLSDEVLEALENGVTITFRVQIEIERRREYIWDETVVSLLQYYELQYHALSEQYIVRVLDSGVQKNFQSLSLALRVLGEIRNLPVIDKSLLDSKAQYNLRLRSEIDINALPAPLRPVAWLSDNWKLASEWFTCPLNF